MPTYTYQCTKCERIFDKFHKLSDHNKYITNDVLEKDKCCLAGTYKQLISIDSYMYKTDALANRVYKDTDSN